MRIRLHWLLIATAVLSIVCWLGAMWALQRANRRAFVRDTQALADAGFVMDWDTVAVGIAPADPAAVAAWTAWCAHIPNVEEDSSLTTWIHRGRGAPPPAATVLVDTHRADMESVLPLVRDGRLRTGLRANLHDWLTGPRDPNALFGAASNLFATRALAHWLRWQALTAQDPAPWLDDLDRLVASGDPPLCLMDGMIGMALAAIRDDTRFAHIRWMGGRLDREHPWFTTGIETAGFVPSIWLGERLYAGLFIDELLLTGDWSPWTGTPPTWRTTLMNVGAALNPRNHWQWATLPSGAAFVRWTQAKQEAAWRGDPPPPPPSGVGGEGNLLAALSLPHLEESHITNGEHLLRARIVRLAACLLLDHRAGVGLPDDAAALTAHYGSAALAAMPGSVPIRYTREPDGGFTLTGDISVPAGGSLSMLRRDHRLTITAADLAP